jgi:hypothetical protein
MFKFWLTVLTSIETLLLAGVMKNQPTAQRSGLFSFGSRVPSSHEPQSLLGMRANLWRKNPTHA